MIRVELESSILDDAGMVVDYAELGELFHWIDEQWDHRTINLKDGVEGLNSTAENLAEVIYWKAKDQFGALVARVGVSETAKTWAYYYE